KIWIPNGAQPPWVIEGMAVMAESEVSAAGRVRASTEEMAARAEALSGRFPRIDQLSSLTLEWPRASNWYTLGGRFLTWIGDEYGLGALRDLSHDFGSRPIPLAINLSSGRVLGKSYLGDSYGEGTIAVDPRGRIVYARTQVYQEFADVQDLYALDPSTGSTERLTRGLRASEPDVARDGALAFTWRRPGGGTAIGLLEPGAAAPRALFADPEGEPVASPRFSPSGE